MKMPRPLLSTTDSFDLTDRAKALRAQEATRVIHRFRSALARWLRSEPTSVDEPVFPGDTTKATQVHPAE